MREFCSITCFVTKFSDETWTKKKSSFRTYALLQAIQKFCMYHWVFNKKFELVISWPSSIFYDRLNSFKHEFH